MTDCELKSFQTIDYYYCSFIVIYHSNTNMYEVDKLCLRQKLFVAFWCKSKLKYVLKWIKSYAYNYCIIQKSFVYDALCYSNSLLPFKGPKTNIPISEIHGYCTNIVKYIQNEFTYSCFNVSCFGFIAVRII